LRPIQWTSPASPREGERLLASAMSRLSLSARAYHRILKVARTIADLAGESTILAPHVAEAAGYRRSLDRVDEAGEVRAA
jgi:predicted ATPase with chaperone activity